MRLLQSGLDLPVEFPTPGATSSAPLTLKRVARITWGFVVRRFRAQTLANENTTRPWRILADLAQHMIGMAWSKHVEEAFRLDLQVTVCACNATALDLRLSVSAWAPSCSSRLAGILRALSDMRGSTLRFIDITGGMTHDDNALDELCFETGSFHQFDRHYLDAARLHGNHDAKPIFVTRAKSNARFKRRQSHAVDRVNTSVHCDRTGLVTVSRSSKGYLIARHRRLVKGVAGKRRIVVTNQLPFWPEVTADMYLRRWPVKMLA